MNQPPNFNTAEIERIVRLVVQRIVRDGAAASSSSASINSKESRPAGELRLDTRLITLDALKGKLGQHVTTLCVPPKAVVTPAVRDELKQRGIELRRADPIECGTALRTPKVIVAAKQSVAAVWIETNSEFCGSTPLAIEQSANLAKQDGMAVLLTEQPEVAACAANRNSGIRALVACGHGDWKTAVKSLGANLIVCDPADWNASDVPQLLAMLWNLRGNAGPGWFK